MCSPALLLSWRNGMTVIRSAVPVRIGVLICIGFLLIAKSGCLEGEIIRAMTRLCVFEHYAFRVEGLPGNNCKRVITFQIQTVLIHLRNTLYGDGALAHDDRHPKIFLDIVIDGMDADLLGESRHQLLVIEIDIEYAGITVQGTDTLYIVQLSSDRESGMPGNMFIRSQLCKANDLGRRFSKVVAFRAFMEGFFLTLTKPSSEVAYTTVSTS